MTLNTKILSAILFISLFAAKNLSAQYQFVADEKGRLLTDKRYENVEGSAYLFPDWKEGEVITNEKKIVQNLSLKYDQVADNLLFQANGTSYEFIPKVTSFVIKSGKLRQKFMYLMKEDGAPVTGYFEVLAEGKFKLYKKVKKILLEAKGYNSANINKVIDENKRYYYVENGKFKELKINKKSIENSLADHKSGVEAYLASNKSLKDEGDIILLFQFLNR
jgi:hypothetical protein